MTTENSICISCENLDCVTSAVFTSHGVRHLVSTCLYGGKNAGNRSSCSKYERASDNAIGKRLDALNR